MYGVCGAVLCLLWVLGRPTVLFCTMGVLGGVSLLVQHKIGAWVFVDGLRRRLVFLTLWVVILTIFVTKREDRESKDWQAVMVSLAFVLVLAFSVNSLIMFYIFFEAALIPTFFLVVRWGGSPERVQAGLYLMLYTVSASLPLLVTIL